MRPSTSMSLSNNMFTHKANNMVANDLAMKGAGASTDMILN